MINRPVCVAVQKYLWLLLVVIGASCISTQVSMAQLVQQAIGGIAVDADGVLSEPSEEDQLRLDEIRRRAGGEAPEDLEPWTDLRAVSLRQLEATLAECRTLETPIPEEVRYLAGLQRVQFVLVYPDQADVVLAGPAEGWRLDALGNAVGLTSSRPVLLLDDLMVALRTRDTAQLEAISCSIDPTPAGITRLQALTGRLRSIGDVETTLRKMEESLGRQVVTVTGVPATSHFARTMVAADFRMKRLAMGFDPAPVGGMPSFLQLLQAGRGRANMTPRWWLAPDYLPLARGADRMAWELRGQGVQCMTEQDYLDNDGKRIGSSRGGPLATRWAQTFSKRFNDLADQDSAFGKLRNAMDLAVVAALIDQERMLDAVDLKLPELLHHQALVQYFAPQHVASRATFVKRRGDYLISTSGGVQLLPWEVANQSELVTEVDVVRDQLSEASTKWYRHQAE
ncbi:MAG: DUF1598 domain-containing protein [Pirellulales bacterium]|nr:DUF1598 domain-containing protein [Pirellulales bacterium]